MMTRQILLLVMLCCLPSCVNTCTKQSVAQDLVGKKLPELSITSTDGKTLRLPDDLLGSYTVLYFYPKDQTPGCTEEAKTFRDNFTRFSNVNAKVFGVSSDSIESHHEFIAEHQLNFPLLTDEKGELASRLGVSSKLGMFSRDTFLIDPRGHIVAVWRDVNATETVFETLRELNNAKR